MNVWCDVAPSVSEDPSALYAKCVVVDASDPQRVLLRDVATTEREVRPPSERSPVASSSLCVVPDKRSRNLLSAALQNFLHCARATFPQFVAKAAQLFYCNENYDPLTTNDVGMLAHPNAASVLELLKTRYLHDRIYVSGKPRRSSTRKRAQRSSWEMQLKVIYQRLPTTMGP